MIAGVMRSKFTKFDSGFSIGRLNKTEKVLGVEKMEAGKGFRRAEG
jgi:hypothetical protein